MDKFLPKNYVLVYIKDPFQKLEEPFHFEPKSKSSTEPRVENAYWEVEKF